MSVVTKKDDTIDDGKNNPCDHNIFPSDPNSARIQHIHSYFKGIVFKHNYFKQVVETEDIERRVIVENVKITAQYNRTVDINNYLDNTSDQ